MEKPLNPPRFLTVEDWGLTPYADALQRQMTLLEQRIAGEGMDRLVITEHLPVYTLGVRKGAGEHVLMPEAERAALGVEVFPTTRGGDVTAHNPGQIVGYPLISLDHSRDLHAYLRNLESVLLAVLSDLGLDARRREGFTGIWIGNRKIAAIGVAVRRWFTYHGFALNVSNDLSFFNGIIPCGIASNEGLVTSVDAELSSPVHRSHLIQALVSAFCSVFDFTPVITPTEKRQGF